MARTVNLTGMSLADLKELRQDVEVAIREQEKVEREELRAKMQMLAAESGFTLDELIGRPKNGKTSVAVKYRNPDNPAETWTGRGRRPRWLEAKLAKRGVAIDDFRV